MVQVDHSVPVKRPENTDHNRCDHVFLYPEDTFLQCCFLFRLQYTHRDYIPSFVFFSIFIPSSAGILTVRIITA